MARIFLALVLAGGLLTAQKVLLDGDPNRQLAAFDVAELIESGLSSGPTGSDQLANFLRGTSSHPGDSLAAIGASHLVAMGSPVWVGSVESMLVHLRKASDTQFQIGLRVCEVPAAFVQRKLRDLLAQDGKHAVVVGAVPILGVVSNDSAVRLVRTMLADPKARIRQMPQITTLQLRPARIRVGRDVSYVRTFEMQTRPDRQQIALPVVDKAWHGYDASVVVARVGKDKIAVDLDLLVSSIDSPVQKFYADVKGVSERVAVDMPRIASFRGAQFAEMTSGSTAVMAAPSDGAWVLTLLTVHQIHAAPRLVPQGR
ncbi:MAG: hypothetical protein ACI85K_001442 [Hyphomicrobiaceae bacterium]|jgi:hypothetical protein